MNWKIVFLAMFVMLSAANVVIKAEGREGEEVVVVRKASAETLYEEVATYLYKGYFVSVSMCGNGDGRVNCNPSVNPCCKLKKVDGTGQWLVTNLDESEVYGGGEGKVDVIELDPVVDPDTGDVIWGYQFHFESGAWWN